jgi:antitoxin component YwqK of YwqJK toxin-antitoxin module
MAIRKPKKMKRNNIGVATTFNICLALVVAIFLFACRTKVVEETIEKYADGSPKVVRFYKDDGDKKEFFKECLYYPNHKKYMEGEYKNSKREGLWVSWFQNGNKWSEGSFKAGLNDGKRIIYYETGKKYIEGTYKDGEKIGVWRFYDENGKIIKEENYSK